MLLPMIFPIARPVFPSSAEKRFTDNSGVEVPKATIVSPTTIGGIEYLRAREEAPDTSKSAPLIRITNQSKKRI